MTISYLTAIRNFNAAIGNRTRAKKKRTKKKRTKRLIALR